MKIKPMDKKGQTGGLINTIIFGLAGLVIGVIVALVIINLLSTGGLLTSGSTEDLAVKNLSANVTEGIGNVSAKIPTVLLVAAIVLVLSVVAVLVAVYQRMRLGGGGSL